MEIFGCTLTEYKKQYEKRLNLYVERFEDRNESVFLEREMINYNDFHNILVNIHNLIIKNESLEKIFNDPQFKDAFNYLENKYNDVFMELFQIGPPLLHPNKIVTHPDDIKEEDALGYIFYYDITLEKLDNIITSTKRILEFINKKLETRQSSDIPEKTNNLGENDTAINTEKTLNPYLQVFSSPKAYELFEKLHETYKSTKKSLADYSFIYRIMYKDGYILDSFKPQMFINWLSKNYNIEISKIKTINNCSTDSKIQNYKTLKEIIQIK